MIQKNSFVLNQDKKKYLTVAKSKELIVSIESLKQMIEGHSYKIKDRVQFEVKHIADIKEIIKVELQANEQKCKLRFNADRKRMEELQRFKEEMGRLVDRSIKKNQELQEKMFEQIKKQVEKGEQLLKQAQKNKQLNIKQLNDQIQKKLMQKIIQFQNFQTHNQQSIKEIKQLASIRIHRSQQKLFKLKSIYQVNSQQLIDKLMQIYSKYHTRIEELKSKRIKQKTQFLDLIDKSVQKLKQVFEEQQ